MRRMSTIVLVVLLAFLVFASVAAAYWPVRGPVASHWNLYLWNGQQWVFEINFLDRTYCNQAVKEYAKRSFVARCVYLPL